MLFCLLVQFKTVPSVASFTIETALSVTCRFFSQTRSYHPGEMAPLRTPYDFDDEGNATSTSTTEPSSSGFRSSMTSRYTTEDGASTLGDDTSVPGAKFFIFMPLH